MFDAISTYVSAAIGALAFSFSDTFWFNGVEAEVYAFSTFLFAAVTYLIMRWNERADNKDSEKYILMIAYLAWFSNWCTFNGCSCGSTCCYDYYV